jgi:prolipoprotein diacylglyceryltransferase
MLPFVRIGPLLLQLPGLALLAGVWIGTSLAEREASRMNAQAGAPVVPIEALNKMIFYGLIAGIVGARLAHAARYPGAYLASPLSLVALTPATLWTGAGLVVGLLTAFAMGWRARLPLRPALDALAPGLATFMLALALAHFLSGDAFGARALRPDATGLGTGPSAPSTGRAPLPWAIYLWGDYQHPTQIYELLAAAGAFALVRRQPVESLGLGLNFLLILALSAGSRLVIEGFRGDSLIWPGGFRAAQVVSLLALAASLGLMHVWKNGNLIDSPSRL